MKTKIIVASIFIGLLLTWFICSFPARTPHHQRITSSYQQPQESQSQVQEPQTESNDQDASNESNLPSGWKLQVEKTKGLYRWCDKESYCETIKYFETKEDTISDAWSTYHDREEEETLVWVDTTEE